MGDKTDHRSILASNSRRNRSVYVTMLLIVHDLCRSHLPQLLLQKRRQIMLFHRRRHGRTLLSRLRVNLYILQKQFNYFFHVASPHVIFYSVTVKPFLFILCSPYHYQLLLYSTYTIPSFFYKYSINNFIHYRNSTQNSIFNTF